MKPLLTTTTALVALGLATFPGEAQACHRTDFISRCYSQFLGRPADAIAINYWLPQMESGCTQQTVQIGILASPEYFGRCGSCPKAFVSRLYVDVLGRPGCPSEIQNWVCRLNQVGCRKRLTLEFLNAAQYELSVRNQMTIPLPTPPVPGFPGQAPGYGQPPVNGFGPGYGQPPVNGFGPGYGQPPVNGFGPGYGQPQVGPFEPTGYRAPLRVATKMPPRGHGYPRWD